MAGEDYTKWPRNLNCFCNCSAPAFYGEMNTDTNKMRWFCAECWLAHSELFYGLQREATKEGQSITDIKSSGG